MHRCLPTTCLARHNQSISFGSVLICPLADENQVVSKLSFDGAMDDPNLVVEHDLVEFFHHLATSELSQVPPAPPRRTRRVRRRRLGELHGIVPDLGLEVLEPVRGLGPSLDEYVRRGGARRHPLDHLSDVVEQSHGEGGGRGTGDGGPRGGGEVLGFRGGEGIAAADDEGARSVGEDGREEAADEEEGGKTGADHGGFGLLIPSGVMLMGRGKILNLSSC
mmetsp:Transcript_25739/g.52700  ORF Transcript_25739/g.52700 Transcript_25739/m.52700 type:complete len:221 (+) Transcript_25739:184-846(+)